MGIRIIAIHIIISRTAFVALMFCFHFCFVLINIFLPRIEGRVREKSEFENKIGLFFCFISGRQKNVFPDEAVFSYSFIFYDETGFYCEPRF